MVITAESMARSLGGKRSGNGWIARCPAHADKNPSMSIGEKNGKILVKCFAGCSNESVIESLRDKNLWPKQNQDSFQAPKYLKTAEYFYKSLDGSPRLRVERFEAGVLKRFSQSHWNGSAWVSGKGEGVVCPWNYESWRDSSHVFLVEGEKCAIKLNEFYPGIVTCIPGGSNGWNESYISFFENKKLCIIPDNDDPGQKFAANVCESLLGKSEIKLLNLPGLTPSQDIVDWIKAGGTKEKLGELLKKEQPIKTKPTNWHNISESLGTEKTQRKKIAEKKISFGIRYLDQCLNGIYPNDLILIGAKTGSGKTELVTNIAHAATQDMKRVYHFALEAEENEITMRLKYKFLAHEYYNTDRYLFVSRQRKLNYMDWLDGAFDDILEECEKKVDQRINFEFENYFVRYKVAEEFTAEKLVREIDEIKEQADLIIIDHFHFLDFDGANENRAMSKAANQIRDCALRLGVPIILVAHIRKGERKGGSLVPDIEDFHGTSNLAKICTKAIMLAPGQQEGSTTRYPTYMKAVKNRRDGSRTRFTALVDFDVTTNSYSSSFMLGRLSIDGSKFEMLTNSNELPYWAQVEAIT